MDLTGFGYMSDLSEADKYKKMMDVIESFRKEYEELEKYKITEVQRVKKMIDLASKTLPKKDYERLETLIPNLENLIKSAKQKIGIKKLKEVIENIGKAIKKLDEAKVDTKEMKELQKIVREDFKAKKFAEAKKNAMKIRDLFDKIEDKELKESIINSFKEDETKPKDKNDDDPPPPEDKGEQQKDEGKTKDEQQKDEGETKDEESGEKPIPKPAGLMNKIMGVLDPDKRKEKEEDLLNEEIKLVWSRIKDSKAKGMDMEEAIETLDKARDALKEKNINDTKKFIEETNKIIEKIESTDSVEALTAKHKEIQDLVNQINDLSQGDEKEANTKDIEGLLKDAKTLIDNKDIPNAKEKLEKANWHANQLLSMMMKNEEKRAIATLTETKNYLKQLKEKGVDITKAKAVFKEAEPALSDGNFDLVIQKAKESMELARDLEGSSQTQSAGDMVEYINNMINELKSLRVDFDKLEPQIKEFIEISEAGKMDQLLEKGEDLKNQLYFLKMEKLKEEAQSNISEISSLILELKHQDVKDLDKAEEAFNKAQDSFNLKEYEQSLEHSVDALLELTTHLRTTLDMKMEEFKGYLDLIETVNVREEEKEKTKAYFITANQWFEREELMKAKAEIQKGKEKSLEVMKSYCTDQMVSIQMAISELQSSLEGEDKGIEEIEAVFIEFGKKFKAHEYPEAIEKNKEVQEKLNKYLKDMVSESIKDIEVKIPKFKDLGIDVVKVTEDLLDIKTLFSDENYVDSFSKVNHVKSDLNNSIKDKATGLIVMIQEEIGNAKEKGIETKRAESKFKELGKKFGESDFLAVIEIGQDIQKTLEEEQLYNKVVEELMTVKNKILEADSMGCDISEAAKLLQTARPLLENNKYQEAMDVATKCREFTQDIIEKTKGIMDELKTKVAEKVQQIEAKMGEMKGTGMDLTKAEAMFDEVKKAQELGDFNSAYNTANECLEELANESKLYNDLLEAISNAKTKITEGKTNGLNVTRAEELFMQMSKALQEKDYETIKEHSRQIVEEIVKQEEAGKRAETAKDDKKNIVLEEVGKTQSLIDSLKKTGIEPTKATELFQKIVPEMQEGNMDSAIELAKESYAAAVELNKIYDEFTPLLGEVKNLIRSTQGEGVVLTEANEIFNNMEKAIGAGLPDEAKKLAVKCAKEVKFTKEEKEKAQNQINEIETQLEEAIKYGLNPPKAAELLESSQQALNKGDYKKSIQLTNDSAVDIINAIPQ